MKILSPEEESKLERRYTDRMEAETTRILRERDLAEAQAFPTERRRHAVEHAIKVDNRALPIVIKKLAAEKVPGAGDAE